tara:strand:+ start:1158 stop:1400 length:243 start_codon:yes stop_codon:yes gene_type:complete
MCRTAGSVAKRMCWCVVVEMNGAVIKAADYPSLKAASEDLGISKNILYKVTAGKVKYAQKDRAFFPKISIRRIKSTDTDL